MEQSSPRYYSGILTGSDTRQLLGGFLRNLQLSVPQPADQRCASGLDFVGPHAAVVECAGRLGGTARLATIEHANTPNTGVVLYVDEDKHEREIDFLGAVASVENTHETSIGAEVLDEAGRSSFAHVTIVPTTSSIFEITFR